MEYLIRITIPREDTAWLKKILDVTIITGRGGSYEILPNLSTPNQDLQVKQEQNDERT